MSRHAKALSEIRILVVDDVAMVLNMVSATLQSLGIRHVSTADSVKTALEKLPIFECPFDAIFLDRYLKEESGHEVLTAIRKKDKVVPVIMLTQEDEGSRVLESINLGATDYIVKPFTSEIIIKKLYKAIGRPVDEGTKE